MKKENQDFLHLFNHITNREEGQSTIEFITSFAFAFSLLFLFVKVALNYTNGYMVHYANYMASRRYLVYDNNTSPASVYANSLTRARESFFKRRPDVFIKNASFDFKANSPGETTLNKKYIGTHVSYEDVLSFTKVVGGRREVFFHSESFLGKEPPRTECARRVCDMLSSSGSNCSIYTTLFDNGC